MDSSPPYPIGPGQRVLAAIVFTDVVSFSARMETKEVETLGLLERDFTRMREICEKYSGTVLKTTGDGLLLYFTSAVQAVTCAQKMQRDFAQRAKDEPSEALKHRIGIHLGEVFVTDQDVMGDGVNIAARIQAQAEPGGIVISQTVYDVVKNKLKLDVAKLSARELKNISEAVTMYRLLLEPPKPSTAGAGVPLRPLPTPAEAPGFSLTGAQKMAVAAALLLGLGLASWLFVQARVRHDEEIARSQAEQAALNAALPKKIPGSDPMATGTKQAAEYDFAALAHRTAPGRDSPEIRKNATARVEVLVSWMDRALAAYTKDRPLLVHELNGALSNDTTVFTGTDHRLYFVEGGAIRARDWQSLKPGVFGAVIVSALLDASPAPPRDVMQGAEAYAYLYSLPEMIDALRKNQPRPAQG